MSLTRMRRTDDCAANGIEESKASSNTRLIRKTSVTETSVLLPLIRLRNAGGDRLYQQVDFNRLSENRARRNITVEGARRKNNEPTFAVGDAAAHPIVASGRQLWVKDNRVVEGRRQVECGLFGRCRHIT